MLKLAKVILFFIIFGSNVVYAEIASPLGLEVAKATSEEVKNKYTVIREGVKERIKMD